MPQGFHEQSEEDFYSLPSSLEALMASISEASEEGIHLYGGILGARIALPELIQGLRKERAHSWGIHVAGSGPYLLSVTNADEDAETSKAFLWDGGQASIVHLLCGQDKQAFERVSKKIQKYLYPDLFRVSFRTNDVLAVLNSVVAQSGVASIRFLEYVARSLIDDPVSSKRVDTIRRWTDESYEAVFQTLAEQGQWLSAYRFEIRDTMTIAGRMWRDGSYLCERGFCHFLSTVVRAYESRMLQSERFYEHRDRLSSPTGSSRPLNVTYKRDIFSNKKENYRLIQALKSLPDCSVAVVHPNPYVHVSILDYMDGSNCDIWVTTGNAVMIVPRDKATGQSTRRICDHICDQFEEGEVVEYLLA
jgi:hypothetical protein